MPSILLRIIRAIEYLIIYFLGKILGVTYIVHYLRNPNPMLTVKILKAFGATIGEKTTFKRTIIIDNSFEDQDSTGDFSNIIIGENCYIGDDVYFDLANKIIIKNNVVISGRVSLITHSDCNRSEFLSQKFPRKSAEINIESGVWLGFGATILSGVRIGENSVVGSMSLVTKDTEEKSINLGIPSKMEKNING